MSRYLKIQVVYNNVGTYFLLLMGQTADTFVEQNSHWQVKIRYLHNKI